MSKQTRLSLDQKQEIIRLLGKGLSRNEIATKLDIAWKQVDYWSRNSARVVKLVDTRDLKSRAFERTGSSPVSCTKEYAYVLGLYLGDGYINLQTPAYGVYKLRITQDVKYQHLVEEHRKALETIFEGNRAAVYHHKNSNAIDVYIHSQLIGVLFPQRGSGPKNKRDVSLEDWQLRIVEQHPDAFLRGLMQTDGSRYTRKQGNHEYVTYNFTNTSEDIIKMVEHCCDMLGLHPTKYRRPSNVCSGIPRSTTKTTITFNKRKDVELLDSVVRKHAC